MEEATVRDGEFYIDGADCVIRVDNTLFRVSLPLDPIVYSTLSPRRQVAKTDEYLRLAGTDVDLLVSVSGSRRC